MPGPVELELLVRPGCHLCDEARAALAVVASDPGLELTWSETDIDSDETLLRRYLERIPVLRRGADELCDLVIEPSDIRAAIGLDARPPGTSSGGY